MQPQFNRSYSLRYEPGLVGLNAYKEGVLEQSQPGFVFCIRGRF